MSVLGSLKRLWNELEVYRPLSIDPVVLHKHKDEDQNFQLLVSVLIFRF